MEPVMADEERHGPAPGRLRSSSNGKVDSELVERQQITNSQDVLMELAQTLTSKYIEPRERTVEDSLSIWMDRFGLKNEITPKYQLVNDLLPNLHEEINKLVILLNCTEPARSTLSQLDKTFDTFNTIDHILDRILDTTSIVWDHPTVNESDKESEALKFRRTRLEQQTDQLAVSIAFTFQYSRDLLGLVNLSEHQQYSDEAIESLHGVIVYANSSCQYVNSILKFLAHSLVDAILDCWQHFTRLLDHWMRVNFYESGPSAQNDFHQDRVKRDEFCLPFFKLCRLFLRKISRPTNLQLGLLSRIPPSQLALFYRETNRILYYVLPLARGLDQMTDQGNTQGCLKNVMAAFTKTLQFIHEFLDHLLDANLSDDEQKTIQTTRKWFKFWEQQLLISLQNLAVFAECQFPEPEEWLGVELDKEFYF